MSDPDAAAEPEGPPPYAKLALYMQVPQYPAVADGKATALLAALGLLVSTLVFFSRPFGQIIKGKDPVQAALVLIGLAPVVVLLVSGITYALRALTLGPPPMPDSLAYARHIAGRPAETFLREMRGLSWRQALREQLHLNYTLAVLCQEKFRLVERGIACLRAAFYLWLALLLRLVVGP